MLFVKLTCSERDIVVTASVWCTCVRACMHPSRFIRAITCTFLHGFQNNLAQLFSMRSGVEVPFETFVQVG